MYNVTFLWFSNTEKCVEETRHKAQPDFFLVNLEVFGNQMKHYYF